MGWLERWDKRNQAVADELMRNPNAGLEADPRVGTAVLLSFGLPGLIVAGLIGVVRLVRRRRRRP